MHTRIVTQHFSNDLLCFVFKNGFLLIASCKCVCDIVNNGLPQLEPIGVYYYRTGCFCFILLGLSDNTTISFFEHKLACIAKLGAIGVYYYRTGCFSVLSWPQQQYHHFLLWTQVGMLCCCQYTVWNHHRQSPQATWLRAWMLWYRMQYTLAWSWSVWRPTSHVGYAAIKLIYTHNLIKLYVMHFLQISAT